MTTTSLFMKTKPTSKKSQPTKTPRVPVKWRWHYNALLAERERLLDERTSLLRSAADPVEPHSILEADSATDEFEHNIALRELTAACSTIREVDDAIHRILDGTYGKCEKTGRPILAARLRALPWTRFSLKAEQELEAGVKRK